MDGANNKKFSIIFVKDRNGILLGLKKRGFGNGKWNGYGGKVEKDEDVLESAVRELEEESTLVVRKEDLKCLGKLSFAGPGSPDGGHNGEVYVFVAEKVKGEATETEEMLPRWFDQDQLPYKDMWADAKLWIKYVLDECYFEGSVVYEEGETLSHNLSWVCAREAPPSL